MTDKQPSVGDINSVHWVKGLEKLKKMAASGDPRYGHITEYLSTVKQLDVINTHKGKSIYLGCNHRAKKFPIVTFRNGIRYSGNLSTVFPPDDMECPECCGWLVENKEDGTRTCRGCGISP